MNDFFLLIDYGVGHQNKQGATHHPDSLPPLLTLHDPILPAEVQRIEKDPRGRVETDAMLSLVAAAFWLVPAQSHLYIQYCIYEGGYIKTRALPEALGFNLSWFCWPPTGFKPVLLRPNLGGLPGKPI